MSKVAVAIAGLATAGLMSGGALAQVVLDDTTNNITFTGGGGSITGLEDLTVPGTIQAGTLTSAAAVVDGINVTGGATVGGTLGVTGATTLNKLTAGTTKLASLEVTGGTTLNGATNINNSLNVTGATTLNSLGVTKNATVGGTLGVTGATTLGGATKINNTLNVTGNTTVNKLTAGATTLGATTADSLTIAGGGPVINAGGIDMKGGTIGGLTGGTIGSASTDVVTGGQIYDYFLAQSSGVRYFHANSEEADSLATGDQSIAIGPKTESKGESSLAAGDEAFTAKDAKDAIALGTGAKAGTDDMLDGEAAIAIGRGSYAQGKSTIAMGDGATVDHDLSRHAIAIGSGATVGHTGTTGVTGVTVIGWNAQASANGATAVGQDAVASGAGAAAFGKGAIASGGNSIALGDSLASAANAFAAGEGAETKTERSISLGVGAGVGTEPMGDDDPGDPEDRTDHIAIGTAAGQYVEGNQTTAIGREAGSHVVGDYNIAIGEEAGTNLTGDRNIAIGHEANKAIGADVHRATAMGDRASAITDGVALGTLANAGLNSVAVGRDSQALEEGVAIGHNAKADNRHIALGHNSIAGPADLESSPGVPALGYLTDDPFVGGTVLSVGNSTSATPLRRRIVNVADGANDYDAVNVRQLSAAQTAVKDLIGSQVTVKPDGTFGGYIVEFEDKNTSGLYHQYSTVEEALYAIHTGQLGVALPPGTLTLNANGNLTVNADATEQMEVVTLRQLDSAIAANGIQYFSVNSTDLGNADNQGAQGTDASAIGPNATAGGISSLAVGHDTDASALHSVAMGHDVTAGGEDSIVLGIHSNVYGEGGVSLGLRALSSGENSITIGTDAQTDPKAGATVDNAIAIGTNSESTADDGIAVGHNALASDLKAVAQGFSAHAAAESSMAFGTWSKAHGVNSQASGTNASAEGESSQAYGTDSSATGTNAQASGTEATAIGFNSVATGTRARAWATDGIAMGTDSVAGFEVTHTSQEEFNHNAIAIGNQAKATELDSTAIGRSAEADAEKAAAFGDDAEARAEKALAAGASARATGEESSAFGAGAQATASKALASGAGATATAASAAAFGEGASASAAGALASGAGSEASGANAAAFGAGARALHDRSVALGDGAETAAAVPTTGFTGWDGNTYAYAGTSPIATVSVGKAGEERTITNVAAGRINSLSTDAINGSQLYQTHKSVGDSVAAALGGDSAYDPDTFTVTADLNVRPEIDNFDNVEDALKYVGQGWFVGVNQDGTTANVAPGDAVDFSNDDGNIIIARDETDLTFNLNSNLVLGSADPDGEDGSVTVTGKDGDQVVLNGKDGTIGMTGADGGGITNVGIKTGDPSLTSVGGITRIYYGGPGEEIQVATLLDGLTFAGDTGTDVDRLLNQTLRIEGGAAGTLTDGNIGVVADGNDLLEIKLAENVDLGEDGSIKMGDATNNTKTDKHGTTVTGTGGTTNVAAGKITVDGSGSGAPIIIDGNSGTIGGLTNKTFDPDNFTSGQAATEDQLKFVSETANAGWYVSKGGEGKTADNKVGPGGVADFSNTDGNIIIDRDETDLTFDLASNLTLGSEDPDGEDGSITVTGKDGNQVVIDGKDGTIGMTGADGSGTITNIGVLPGDPNLGGTNITRIYYNDGGDDIQVATLLDGLKFAGDDVGTEGTVDRKLNETLNLTGGAKGNLTDGNIGVVQNTAGDGFEIKLAENIDLGEDGSLTIGDSVVDNTGLEVDDGKGNVTTTTATGTTVTDGTSTTTVAAGSVTVTDGTNTIVMDAGTGTIAGLTNQTINYPEFADGSGRAATEEQLKEVNTTANMGWQVSVNDNDGNNEEQVKPGDRVDFQNSDNNIVIAKKANDDGDGYDIVFDLAKDVKLVDDGSLTVGQTVVNDDGVQVGDHVALHDEGLTVTDDDGNATNVAATGTTVEDKDGNKTVTSAGGVDITTGDGSATASLGAGSLELTDGANTVLLDAGTGTLSGLTNQTIKYPEFADGSGRSATEEQLGEVYDVATAGWDATDAYGNTINIGPEGKMDFASGNNNIKVDLHGKDNDGQVLVTMSNDLNLTEDGSVTIGDTLLDNDGLTVDDGKGNSTTTTAGGTTVTGDDGTTTVGAGTVTVAGGDPGAPVVTIDGNEGTIGGLTNKTFTPGDIVSGQAATEDQIQALYDMPLTFVDDYGNDVKRKLGDELNIIGGATNQADLTMGNIGVVAVAPDTLEVRLNKDIDLGDDGSLKIGRTTVNNNGLVINGGPSVTVGGINAGGKQITNVADGTQNDHAINLGQLNRGLTQLDNELTAKGMNFSDEQGGSTHRDLGQTMQFVGADDNISTRVAGDGVLEIALNKHLKLESVEADEVVAREVTAEKVVAERVEATQVKAGEVIAEQVKAEEVVAGDVTADRVTATDVQADQVVSNSILTIDLSSDNIYTDNVTINNGGPIINEGGIDMAGNRIVNVSPGVNPGDAANVGQLQAVHNNLQGQITDVRQDLRRTDRRLRGGVAAAMATAALPQAYLPGKSMMAVAGGTWNGESGMAVGYSGISDNGNWVFKLSGNASSRGDYGGAVGVGYQW